MLSFKEYFGKWITHPDVTDQVKLDANKFLHKVFKLHQSLIERGLTFPYNPKTGSNVSGEQYGGFRPQACPIGAPKSSHKLGRAVDVYDPENEIDNYLLLDYELNKQTSLLVQCGIYIEHPDATPGWSHWSDKAPGSGKQIFYP